MFDPFRSLWRVPKPDLGVILGHILTFPGLHANPVKFLSFKIALTGVPNKALHVLCLTRKNSRKLFLGPVPAIIDISWITFRVVTVGLDEWMDTG